MNRLPGLVLLASLITAGTASYAQDGNTRDTGWDDEWGDDAWSEPESGGFCLVGIL
jgi:hypothetical protein